MLEKDRKMEKLAFFSLLLPQYTLSTFLTYLRGIMHELQKPIQPKCLYRKKSLMSRLLTTFHSRKKYFLLLHHHSNKLLLLLRWWRWLGHYNMRAFFMLILYIFWYLVYLACGHIRFYYVHIYNIMLMIIRWRWWCHWWCDPSSKGKEQKLWIEDTYLFFFKGKTLY